MNLFCCALESGSDLDVVVVLQAVLHVVEEGEDVDPVQAAVQQRVHALKRGLPQVQPVIHCVFERTHLHLHKDTSQTSDEASGRSNIRTCQSAPHLSDQLLPDFGLVVQLR